MDGNVRSSNVDSLKAAIQVRLLRLAWKNHQPEGELSIMPITSPNPNPGNAYDDTSSPG